MVLDRVARKFGITQQCCGRALASILIHGSIGVEDNESNVTVAQYTEFEGLFEQADAALLERDLRSRQLLTWPVAAAKNDGQEGVPCACDHSQGARL